MDAEPARPGGSVRGVGVDAVDVERFKAVLARRPGLARRLFTEAERDYAGRAAEPGARLAVRFAAKEAVLKALGVGLGAAPLRQVEIVRDERGAPGVALAGRAAAVAAGRGVTRWHLSLSHTKALALASAVAEGPCPRCAPGAVELGP